MAANVTQTVIDGAPGNAIVLAGTGLTPGPNAIVTLANQGVTAKPGISQHTLTIPATFASDGTSVSFLLPDGITTNTLTVTANDGTSDQVELHVHSQYVQASEYATAGEGWDLSSLAPGELDIILRRASARVDTILSSSLRLLQQVEQHKYRAPRNSAPPRLFPWRVRGRTCPIVSVDQLTFVSAYDLVTTFAITDTYVNNSEGYIEILAYAVGNYALLGALQVIGYSANVFELTLTTGYKHTGYPSAVVDATIMIASAMLEYRNAMRLGLGGLKSVGKDLPVSQGKFVIPDEARRILRPYINMTVS